MEDKELNPMKTAIKNIAKNSKKEFIQIKVPKGSSKATLSFTKEKGYYLKSK